MQTSRTAKYITAAVVMFAFAAIPAKAETLFNATQKADPSMALYGEQNGDQTYGDIPAYTATQNTCIDSITLKLCRLRGGANSLNMAIDASVGDISINEMSKFSDVSWSSPLTSSYESLWNDETGCVYTQSVTELTNDTIGTTEHTFEFSPCIEVPAGQTVKFEPNQTYDNGDFVVWFAAANTASNANAYLWAEDIPGYTTSTKLNWSFAGSITGTTTESEPAPEGNSSSTFGGLNNFSMGWSASSSNINATTVFSNFGELWLESATATIPGCYIQSVFGFMDFLRGLFAGDMTDQTMIISYGSETMELNMADFEFPPEWENLKIIFWNVFAFIGWLTLCIYAFLDFTGHGRSEEAEDDD